MAASLVIGIDSSTTGCKAIAWDPHGQAVAEGRVTYSILRAHPTWAEQDAEQWWRGVCDSLVDLSRELDFSQVEAVCITAQRESFVLLDRKGAPIRRAILWLDERSRSQVSAMAKVFGPTNLHQMTGKPPSMSLALPKILWLMEHEPESIHQTARLLDTHGYLIYRLTGDFITSLACADPLGLVDIRAQTWANDILQEVGLSAGQFPDLVQPGTVIGHVSPAVALACKLPAGLPIIAGAGDGQSAGLGANAIGNERVYLNLGTAVVSGAFSTRYLVDPAFRTHFAPISGSYFLETVVRGGVSTVNWFADQFAGDLRDSDPSRTVEEQLEMAASRVPPGSLGLLCIPYWNSVMNPYWDPLATGITLGWTAAHGRAHFYRAILEGLAFEQKLASYGMTAALGQGIAEYIAVGGGSRSSLWCQIVADITGIPVRRARTAEASCLGAGILAAVAAGWYPSAEKAAEGMAVITPGFVPEPEVTAIYQPLFDEVYRPFFPAVQHLIDHLSEITQKNIESGTIP